MCLPDRPTNMELLKQLYGEPDRAKEYARDAMADSIHVGAPEDVEDCTDDGA